MVTIPFDRNGFTEVVPANAPVKKTDEEKIVKALKLNRHLIMDDIHHYESEEDRDGAP